MTRVKPAAKPHEFDGSKPHEFDASKPLPLDELRCPICGKLLARVRLVPGSAVEVHCRHCRRWLVRECA